MLDRKTKNHQIHEKNKPVILRKMSHLKNNSLYNYIVNLYETWIVDRNICAS